MARADVTSLPPRYDIVGTPISLTTYQEVLKLLGEEPAGDAAQTYAFCNVHSVMTARKDGAVAKALEEVNVAAPDGMPLVWHLRASGHHLHDRVYGPELTRLALREGVERGWRHYFHGGSPAVLDALVTAVRCEAPGIQVVGTNSPPFRPFTPADVVAAAEAITTSKASHVWLGLGMPKQELFMDQLRHHLPGRHLLAVGAAFDFLAGTVPQAPHWMQQRGLEWAFRLRQEPRRLWRRYAINNPHYVLRSAQQLLTDRLAR